MNDCIVVLNCGLLSIKFVLFDVIVYLLLCVFMWSGKVEGIGIEYFMVVEVGVLI